MKVNNIISQLNKIVGITKNNNNFDIKQKTNLISNDNKDKLIRQEFIPSNILNQDELLMLRNLFRSENDIKSETGGYSIDRNRSKMKNVGSLLDIKR